ncbi:hypothetical protein APA386B_1250 [Acetobacter pasteurianus 386B]|nr:hypothetical protein APA386B_1250 [Acetobacter pasteurianus 386B]
MTLQTGLFCISHAAGQQPPTSAGLPGVRISLPPVSAPGNVQIVTFEQDGWMGGRNNAALVRVRRGPAQVMITIYQELNTRHDAPRLQVIQLSAESDPLPVPVPAAVPVAPVAEAPKETAPAEAPLVQKPEIGAHIQRRGDVTGILGEWMGVPGSQAWIEGFGIAPAHLIQSDDIEYQAVLGKGWLSPWVEGGQYCGSRGMALPILGLCVRLKGAAAKKFICRVTASFTDGTKIGPVDNGEPVEADSLAPLEAFLVEILPRDAESKPKRGGRKRKQNAAEDLAALLEEEIEELEAEVLEDAAEILAEEELEEEIEEDVEEEVVVKPVRRAAKSQPRRASSAAQKGAKPKATGRGGARGRKPSRR